MGRTCRRSAIGSGGRSGSARKGIGEIPTCSGGLGVLVGDTVRTAADLELPLVGVTLVSRAGYFRQEMAADGR